MKNYTEIKGLIKENKKPEGIQKQTTLDPTLLAQGTYGCIYKNAHCIEDNFIKTAGPYSVQIPYITKIQNQNYIEDEQDEIEFGRKIQSIPLYQYRYAPIIKKCTIRLASISPSECKALSLPNGNSDKHSTKQIKSTKIRYVGKYTLGNYFTQIHQSLSEGLNNNNKDRDTRVFQKIKSAYFYLKNSLTILNDSTTMIVHHDLKENNIIMDTINNVPIIIDYGLSFYWNQSLEDFTKNNNFIFEMYEYWSIENYILGFLLKFNPPVYLAEHSKLIFDKFFVENQVFSQRHDSNSVGVSPPSQNNSTKIQYFSLEEISEFEKKTLNYLSSFVGKTIVEVFSLVFVEELIKTWDQYSLAVIFLFMSSNIAMDTDFIVYLKGIILARPTERSSLILLE